MIANLPCLSSATNQCEGKGRQYRDGIKNHSPVEVATTSDVRFADEGGELDDSTPCDLTDV